MHHRRAVAATVLEQVFRMGRRQSRRTPVQLHLRYDQGQVSTDTSPCVAIYGHREVRAADQANEALLVKVHC